MNSYDIFRKLTKGIKFNQKRFGDDLQKIGVSKSKSGSVKENKEIGEEGKDTGDDISEHFSAIGAPPKENAGSEKTDDGSSGGVKLFTDLHIDSDLISRKKKKKRKKKIGGEEEEEKSEKQKQLELQQEHINHFRNVNGIHVWGTDIPAPIENFDMLTSEYKVKEVLASNLGRQGYLEPMPIQMQAWSLMLSGREILASAPTGSGKTAAFIVPILHQLEGPRKKGFRAVLLAPTRELARQTHRECVRLSEGLGFKVHIISNVKKAKQKFGPKSSKKFDILVTTPNRLVYLLQEGDTSTIDLSNVEWLVIDESDRLFEGGTGGFRDQLVVIYQACTNPNIKRALFSATFAYEVQQWCKLNLNNVAMVSIGIRNTASADVAQELLFCGEESGKLFALRDILRKGYKPPVLIFVQTKERAKELFRELIYDNIMVDAIHADRTLTQRDNVVRAFRERKIWVLICTELMARGIDFKGVNLVINYDFPQSVISYIHRVGRTGRAQHKGRAVTFWTMEDKPYLRDIAQVLHSSRQEVPEWMLKLKKLKRHEKRSLQAPDRGHVSYYEEYREKTKLHDIIRKKRLEKREKRAAKEMEDQDYTDPENETVLTQDEYMNDMDDEETNGMDEEEMTGMEMSDSAPVEGKAPKGKKRKKKADTTRTISKKKKKSVTKKKVRFDVGE